MTPFNMSQPPMKQVPFLLPVIWAGSFVMTRQFGLKIQKKNMAGIKPPFLVFSTHQGFSDYYIAPLALFPRRANYVSDMEGFAAFGEWLYRAIGCIGKRRYVPDIRVMQNIKRALDGGQSVVIFPESRHSNVGTTAELPDNLGRLAKILKVPVVVLSVHGSYLANPFWDEEHTRKVPMEATLECICTKEKLEQMSAEELQQQIESMLQYDEYAWQQEKKIRITEPKRAEGLHKALYQCRECGAPYKMESVGSRLICNACGAEWILSEEGWLVFEGKSEHKFSNMELRSAEACHECKNESVSSKMEEICAEAHGEYKKERLHIPDWYEWQRGNVEKELGTTDEEKSSGKECQQKHVEEKSQRSEREEQQVPTFQKSCCDAKDNLKSIRQYAVEVEALPNSKGFVSLGEGSLLLDAKGFRLTLPDSKHSGKELFFDHASRGTIQTEYNYKGRGPCIVLSDKDCCYYIYSKDSSFQPTELQFMVEYLGKYEKYSISQWKAEQ